jgi:hypothetical protein
MTPYSAAVALFLSMHAVHRMRARHITRDEIEQGLTGRETVSVSNEDPTATVILCSTDAGRKLKVVVATDDENFILTAAARGDEG